MILYLFNKLATCIIYLKIINQSCFFLHIDITLVGTKIIVSFFRRLLYCLYLFLKIINNLLIIFLIFLFQTSLCIFMLIFLLNTHSIIDYYLTLFKLRKLQIMILQVLILEIKIMIFFFKNLFLIFIENLIDFLLNFLSNIVTKKLHAINTNAVEKIKQAFLLINIKLIESFLNLFKKLNFSSDLFFELIWLLSMHLLKLSYTLIWLQWFYKLFVSLHWGLYLLRL